MYTLSDIIDDLSKNMSEKRFIHTLGVADTAEKMAIYYNIDIEKALYAAILHDCSKIKNMSADGMLELSSRSLFENKFCSIDVGEQLLHSAASEVIAREKYGIEDIDILSAIRWHTTGKRNMSKLDMLIYSADMIEQSRTYDGVERSENWHSQVWKNLHLNAVNKQ